MKKILFGLLSLVLIALVGGTAALYVFRDQILLTQARAYFPKLAPLDLKLGKLRTEVIGPFAITLYDLEVNQGGMKVVLKETRLSSTETLLALYQIFKNGKPLPLSVDAVGMTAALPPSKTEAKAKSDYPAWPKSLSLPSLSPVPLALNLRLSQGEVNGPMRLSGLAAELVLHANAEAVASEGKIQLQASLPGAEGLLPASLEYKLAGTMRAMKLVSFKVKAAGLEGNGSGEFTLEPVSAKFKLSAAAASLGELALRAEDRAALGLSAQPSGALAFKIEGSASATGDLEAAGEMGLANVNLPLKWPGKTIFSKALNGAEVDGPVALKMAAPFSVRSAWPPVAPNLAGSVSGSLDLTPVRVVKPNMLQKPPGVPLSASFKATLHEKGITVESLRAVFHKLSLESSLELAQPLGSIASGSFKVDIPSLAGFPVLLPVLRQAEGNGAAIAEAQGTISAEGRMRVLAKTPAQSMVDLKRLSLKNVRLPLNYKNPTLEANGLLLASVQGAGKYDAGELSVANSSGQVDLSGMSLVLPGKFAKKPGKKLLIGFEASGNPKRLVLKKASLAADGLSATALGSVASQKGRLDLDLTISALAELAPLREYLPKMPMKISGGNFDARAKVTGAWLTEGGIEKSPLAVTGQLNGKMGSVEMPEAPKEAAAAAPLKESLLPNWPVARNSKLAFRFELAQFTRGPLNASGIDAQGNYDKGLFTANVNVAKTFGGKASLRSVQGDLREAAIPVKGQALVEGMDLSLMAGFVDASYKEIVKGTLKADSSFAVPDVMGADLIGTASAGGKAEIKNCYVSTASLDTLVNQKLAGIPGVGDKAKLKTGGMAADMRTNFSYQNSVATLTDFVANTPAGDEMRMQGTMAMTFDCDLKGEAKLKNAPVTGPIREANSDAEGRLVVPIHFKGNLKNPSVDIAADIIQQMIGKTATREANKIKDKAVEEGKKKLEEEAKKAAGGLLDGLFKKR